MIKVLRKTLPGFSWTAISSEEEDDGVLSYEGIRGNYALYVHYNERDKTYSASLCSFTSGKAECLAYVIQTRGLNRTLKKLQKYMESQLRAYSKGIETLWESGAPSKG